MFHLLEGDVLISSAFGLFRLDTLISAVLFSLDTLGEDMDVVLRLQTLYRPRGMKIVYERNAICYTGIPGNLKQLFLQGNRWHRGLFDCLMHNGVLVGNWHYGALGLISMPYQILFELLMPFHVLLGPILVTILLLNDILKIKFILISNLGFLLFEFILSYVADSLDQDRFIMAPLRILKLLLLTNLSVILQLYLALARMWGVLSFHWRRMVW